MKCKHCGARLVVKNTQPKPTQLTQPYYFTAYYKCPSCGRMYHDEKFKVTNQNFSLFTDRHSLSPVGPIEIEIWTDGACSRNGTPEAKAAWAFVSGDHEESGLVEGKQTNNRAEALAVLHALAWAAKQGYKRIRLHSDSQITIFGVQKVHHLVKANQDIFREIAETIRHNQLEVEYVKVLGHSGDVNNERADKLANGLVGI